MMQFKYITTKSFDSPGPNQTVNSITVYYKMDKPELDEFKIIVDYVEGKFEQFQHLDAELYETVNAPVKGHKKKNGIPYTTMTIVQDLKRQLDNGKDPTKSMVHRWNAAMKQLELSDYAIEMVKI